MPAHKFMCKRCHSVSPIKLTQTLYKYIRLELIPMFVLYSVHKKKIQQQSICEKAAHKSMMKLSTNSSKYKKTPFCFTSICAKISLHFLGCNYCQIALVYFYNFYQKLFTKKMHLNF